MKLLLPALLLIATLTSTAQTRTSGPWWPSRWGAADQAGASNWITPEKIIAAMKHVKTGTVYELGHPYERQMPYVGIRSYKLNVVDTGPSAGKNAVIGNEEIISGELAQVGTQFDGPGHIGAMLKYPDGSMK